MATGFPVKANYATGDVLTAANMNDLAGTLNYLDPTAKGDLFPASDGSTLTRLAVGTNGQVLTADSTQTTGIKWATPATSSSGLTYITGSTFSNQASVIIDNCFSSTYDQYVINFTNTYGATTTDDPVIQFRYGTTTATAGYYGSWWYYPTSGTSFTTGQYRNAAQLTMGPNVGDTTAKASGMIYVSNGVNGSSEIANFWGNWTTSANGVETASSFGGSLATAQIYTGFLFKSTSSNVTGTIRVYGLAKS